MCSLVSGCQHREVHLTHHKLICHNSSNPVRPHHNPIQPAKQFAHQYMVGPCYRPWGDRAAVVTSCRAFEQVEM